MATRFDAPRQWEDWVSWVLGLGLILSPWIFMFWTEPLALRNAVIAGFVLVLLEAVTLTVQRWWEEVVNLVIGLWLIVSPFVLAIASRSATILFIVVGLCVVALAALELREIGARRAS